jgi:hypothetical protein
VLAIIDFLGRENMLSLFEFFENSGLEKAIDCVAQFLESAAF